MSNEFSILKCVERIKHDSFEPYYEIIVSTEIPVLSLMDARADELTAAVLADQLGSRLLDAIGKHNGHNSFKERSAELKNK